jgi:hypothetical protein
LSGFGTIDPMHGIQRRRQSTGDRIGNDVIILNDQKPHGSPANNENLL